MWRLCWFSMCEATRYTLAVSSVWQVWVIGLDQRYSTFPVARTRIVRRAKLCAHERTTVWSRILYQFLCICCICFGCWVKCLLLHFYRSVAGLFTQFDIIFLLFRALGFPINSSLPQLGDSSGKENQQIRSTKTTLIKQTKFWFAN